MKTNILYTFLLLIGVAMLPTHSTSNDSCLTKHAPENMFGTDGIRATIGDSPFTHHELIQMGHALGTWATQKYGPDAHILVGHDTRISCSWVKVCLKTGLLKHKVHLIDAGELPTPAIVQLTLNNDTTHCGIIISASHNPFQDNGIKIIDGHRGKLSIQDEQYITHLFFSDSVEEKDDSDNLGTEIEWHEAEKIYVDHIKQFFQPHFLVGKKIVLDCAHGATYRIAPALFRSFGADVISIGDTPNGTNINEQCGATHVEQLKQKVIQEQADIGFAFDGDGDRVIAVNRYGDIKDGDAILALLIEHPHYKGTQAVVGTIMSNKGFENWLLQKGYHLIRTPVGDKYIAREMEKEEGKLTLGGEQSGHIILYDYLPTGDGIFTALRIIETMIMFDNNDMNSFKAMPQFLINVPVKVKKPLTEEPFSSIIKEKAALIPDGRIIARFSGTEDLLRVMVEDDNAELAYRIGKELAGELQQALGV